MQDKEGNKLISRRGFIAASLAGSAFMGMGGIPHRAAAALIGDDKLAKTGKSARTLAFPGAEGFGAHAVGGRGGKILFVTNLEDYHPEREKRIPGSLRAAVETEGPRIVIFRVSGTIPLKRTLSIREPYITIAGQSAPGGGICLKNYGVGINRNHDVIIRYLRVRPGDELGPDHRSRGEKFHIDAIGIGRGSRNIIIDHCSTSWSTDEVLSVSGEGITGVTIQWCFITESLHDSYHNKGPHGYGSLIRCNGNVTYHHNLYAHHDNRTPRPGTYGEGAILLDFRNNVVYNSVHGGYSSEDPVRMNYVGNYIKRGPNSKWKHGFVVNPTDTQIYSDDNLHLAHDGSEWPVFSNGDYTHLWQKDEPFATAPVKTDSPTVTYRRVLASAGATLPVRDEIDERIVREVLRYEGKIIDSQSEVGGWPELRSTAPARDSDNDGMPDWWELAHGLDPMDPSDAHEDPDGDGYTNIEEFLNGTDPNVKD